MSSELGLVSLFSGGMGLDLGMEAAGFHIHVANEVDDASVETIRRNRPELPLVHKSIVDVDARVLSEAAGLELQGTDVVAGGPPCQAFSIMGRRRGVSDQRGTLIWEFVRVVDEIRPRAFVMENVRGLHSMPLAQPKSRPEESWRSEKGSLFRAMISEFESIGYRVDTFMVNSANYGAPQVRERMICIGSRYPITAEFPLPTHSNRPEDGLPPFTTLSDVIGAGFVDPDPTLMNFSERKLRFLALVPPGGNWRSLPEELQREAMGKQYFLKGGRSSSWRRLSWDFPSPTVHTLPNHATTSMCHPGELRALTAGECAAIQEFPATWRFQGSPSDRYRQIGNAVPIRLGNMAGNAVADLLERATECGLIPTDKAAEIEPSRVVHLRPHVRVKRWWKGGNSLSGNHSYYPDDDPQTASQCSLFGEDD